MVSARKPDASCPSSCSRRETWSTGFEVDEVEPVDAADASSAAAMALLFSDMEIELTQALTAAAPRVTSVRALALPVVNSGPAYPCRAASSWKTTTGGPYEMPSRSRMRCRRLSVAQAVAVAASGAGGAEGLLTRLRWLGT